MKRLAMMLLAIACLMAVAAQDRFVVNGRVLMADTTAWVPLDSLAVSVQAVGDTAATRFELLVGDKEAGLANGADLRLMVYGPRGKYNVTLMRDGYDTRIEEVDRRYDSQSSVWIGAVKMCRSRRHMLDEVTVTATAIKMVMEGDTIVYNAAAFQLADGSMLDALVQQLPGAELDKNGQIKVNGRHISSLLLNGKDFFKGDPTVALENLPAFAVKNIKVYDKAADNDYLTLASNKLARDENEENLVMDVVLKKEYSTSWMATAEGGYGTVNRYVGNLFGLGFTDNVRVSAYVNANNLGEMNYRDRDGNVYGTYSSDSGDRDTQKAGADYYYESKKVTSEGNLSFTHNDISEQTEVSATDIYPTRKLFSRSASQYHDTEKNFETSHRVKIKLPDAYIAVNPRFSWRENGNTSLQRKAQFDRQPQELTRTEALDSVLTYTPSLRYDPLLLTTLVTGTARRTSDISGALDLSAYIRTPSMPGSLDLRASARLAHSGNNERKLYNQRPGGANPTGTPMTTDRYFDRPSDSRNAAASAQWRQNKDRMTERRRLSHNITAGISYAYAYSSDAVSLWDINDILTGTPIPPLMRPEDALRLIDDCRNTTRDTHSATPSVSYSFTSEPLAPGDSTFNARYGIDISADTRIEAEHYLYQGDNGLREELRRTAQSPSGRINLSLRSQNKVRFLSMSFSYRLAQSLPSLTNFLNVRNSDNPLVIYDNNARNLRRATNSYYRFDLWMFGRSKPELSTQVQLGLNTTDNATAASRTYDPLTGVNVYRPMNINGIWQANTHVSQNVPIGKKFVAAAKISYNHRRTAEMTALAGQDMERQDIDNDFISATLGLRFKLPQRSWLSLSGGTNWNNTTSTSSDFGKVRTTNYNADFTAYIELPANIIVQTNLNWLKDAGYAQSSLNVSRWIWNASLEKSILKGDLVFKLRANDILNQKRPLNVLITENRYEERWHNTLGRYAMLSVAYKFRKSPKKP